MPRVKAEVLETVVANTVKDIFDPRTRQIYNLTQRIDHLGNDDQPVRNSRPRINMAMHMSLLSAFTGGFGEIFLNLWKNLNNP